MTQPPVPDSPGVRFPPPLIYFGVIAVTWAASRSGPWPAPLPLPPTLRLACGVVLLSAGLLLDLWAVGRFRGAGTTLLPFRGAARFVVTGPYRFTRNPMYLGMTLVTLSLAFLVDDAWYLAAALVAAWFVGRFVIRREERYLEVRFGDDYRAYCRTVGRWLGARLS